MFGFRSHSVMWKIFCTNEALRSAMKQFGFGGTDLVRCLLLRQEETGSVGCDLIRTGNGTSAILCDKSVTLQKRLK